MHNGLGWQMDFDFDLDDMVCLMSSRLQRSKHV